jgi:LmeA-like phospholipid-binding
MRKFLIVLLGLAVLLVIVDRAGVFIAEREIGTRVQSAYHLPARPHVTIQGIPFLTQLISGHYQQIDVSIASAPADGVQLHDINAKFTGVKASLSLLLGQDSGSVTASQATATALLPFSEVQKRLPQGIKIGPDGSSLSVAGTGVYSALRGTVRLAVSRTGITVTPKHVTLAGISSIAGISTATLVSRLTFTIPVSGLPLHLSLTGVHVTKSGVMVDAGGHNVQFANA